MCCFLMGVLFSCNGQPNNNHQLKKEVQDLVNELDSISKIDTTLYIDDSYSFEIFKKIHILSNQQDLIFLLEHDNSVIKGYAYLSLKINENNNADTLYKKYFKPLKVCVNDVCKKYAIASDDRNFSIVDFFYDMKPKINRIKNILKLKGQTKFIDEEEEKVIKEENKIREEQGVPLLEEPK